MVPLTRRRLLHAAVALLAGTAGCNGSQSSSVTGTAVAGPAGRPSDAVVPEHCSLRTPADAPPVWLLSEGDGETSTSSATPRLSRAQGFVASTDAAERLGFADVDGAAAARRFVSNTDFDSETLLLETRTVDACRTLSLCHVSWTDSSIDTAYGSTYRDADVDCDADGSDSVSTLIRIPEALDPDAIRSRGSSWGSSGCDRRRPPGDDPATEPPNYGPKTSADATVTEEDAEA
jgi:hypothetical protein